MGNKEVIVRFEERSSSFKDDRHLKSSNEKSKKNIIEYEEYIRFK